MACKKLLDLKSIAVEYCSEKAWGTVGQDCQRIKIISQTFRRNTLQTTAVKSSPEVFRKKKKQVNRRNGKAIFKLNEYRKFLTAYAVMHTGAW